MSEKRNPYFLVWFIVVILGLGLLIGIIAAIFDRGDTIKTLEPDRVHRVGTNPDK